MFYSIRKEYVLEAEPGEEQVSEGHHTHTYVCLISSALTVMSLTLVSEHRGELVALAGRAPRLQSFPNSVQSSEEVQRGRRRAADRQPARPL